MSRTTDLLQHKLSDQFNLYYWFKKQESLIVWSVKKTMLHSLKKRILFHSVQQSTYKVIVIWKIIVSACYIS